MVEQSADNWSSAKKNQIYLRGNLTETRITEKPKHKANFISVGKYLIKDTIETNR